MLLAAMAMGQDVAVVAPAPVPAAPIVQVAQTPPPPATVDPAAQAVVPAPAIPVPADAPPADAAAAATRSAPVQTRNDAVIQHPDIVVTGRADWEAPDPLSEVNEKAFAATLAVDKAVVGPVARVYKKKVPSPIRRGIHNFLYNLREPVVFVNFVFQHKIGKALETVGRFALNSTIGVVGLFDMAKRKPFRLPRRSNGFANTLGFYGVPNGPFLFLPLVGPTTVRDLFGGAIDRIVLPVALGQGVTDPKFAIPAGILGALDHRAEFDETLDQLQNDKGDPYTKSRDFYLQRRQAEIDRLKGRATGTTGGLTEAPKGPIRIRPRADAVESLPAGPEQAPPGSRVPTPTAPVPPVAVTVP